MKEIVEKGLQGLANAGLLNGGHWFVGHFGAEVLSLAFILIDKQVDKSIEPLVQARINTCVNTQASFFETPISCEETDRHLSLDDFYCATRSSIAQLYVDGHHTIYAALALRALKLYPDLARPEIIKGLLALLEACESAGFDRYYGLDNKAFFDKQFTDKFSFSSAKQAACVALKQHSQVITDQSVGDEFYFFSGSRLHLITHAQALLELEQLGFSDLVAVGLPTYAKHCICIDASQVPEGVQAYQVRRVLDPRTKAFWQREVTNPHHAKLAYAVMAILSAHPKENIAKAFADLSAYWEFYD